MIAKNEDSEAANVTFVEVDQAIEKALQPAAEDLQEVIHGHCEDLLECIVAEMEETLRQSIYWKRNGKVHEALLEAVKKVQKAAAEVGHVRRLIDGLEQWKKQGWAGFDGTRRSGSAWRPR